MRVRVLLLTALTLVCLALSVEAQIQIGDVKYFGGNSDAFSDVFRMHNGNYAMTGIAALQEGNNPDGAAWILVINPDGEVLLDRTYEGFYRQAHGVSIIQLDDEGFMVAGGGFWIADDPGKMFWAFRTESDGDLVWRREYMIRDSANIYSQCCSVIESKAGEVFLCGATRTRRPGERYFSSGRDAFILKIDPADGEPIWQRSYGDRNPDIFSTMLDADDALIVAGSQWLRGAWILSINKRNGDINWEHTFDLVPEDTTYAGYFNSLVSDGGNYIAFGNARVPLGNSNYWYPNTAVKFRPNGEIIWQRSFELPGRHYFMQGVYAAVRLPWGGYIVAMQGDLLGDDADNAPIIVRLNTECEIEWYRMLSDTLARTFFSVVSSEIDGTIFVGSVGNMEHQGGNAIFMRGIPEVSAPVFRRGHFRNIGRGGEGGGGEGGDDEGDWRRDGFNLTVVRQDTVQFWANAFDWQDGDITYTWRLEGEEIGNDTTVTVIFDELGQKLLTCTADDGELADSIFWRVNVIELMFLSKRPMESPVYIPRGGEGEFEIEYAAAPDGEVTYRWELDDAPISDERTLIHSFQRLGYLNLEGYVEKDTFSICSEWAIEVWKPISSWWPEPTELSILKDSVLTFTVTPWVLPSIPSIIWSCDGEEIAADTDEVEIEFTEEGVHQVMVEVGYGEEAEWVQWQIDVSELSIEQPEVHPEDYGLSFYPNPFNSSVTISYSVGLETAATRLGIYDINGRQVADLLGSTGVSAGQVFQPAAEGGATVKHGGMTAEQTVVWDASGMAAGVYLVRLKSGPEIRTIKALLMK